MMQPEKRLSLDSLEGKCVFITGGTGLIGRTLIRNILENTKTTSVLACVRNPEKAQKVLSPWLSSGRLSLTVSDILAPITVSEKIDYIVHAASETSSKAFVNKPTATIFTAIDGTRNMLELARQKQVEAFVYLSTMEVYGAPSTDEKIFENHPTNLDTTQVRSSYPESKRLCETLCTAYATEYGVPTKILRLTQTFGPGVAYNDGRIFAEFARCVIENRDIILHTKGETKRNYLYTEDAATAILAVLQYGEKGNAYNAANESTYCSIYEMANLVAQKIACGKIKVVIDESDPTKFGYAPTLHMNLDTSKLRALGWEPSVSLEEAFRRMIQDMQSLPQ